MRKQFISAILLLMLLLWLGNLAVGPSGSLTGQSQISATNSQTDLDRVRGELIYIDAHTPEAMKPNKHLKTATGTIVKQDLFMTDMHEVSMDATMIDTRGTGNNGENNIPVWIQLLRHQNTELEKEKTYSISRNNGCLVF